MIVLDASVLIAHLDTTDLHYERASALLHDAADEALAAGPITLAEVLVGPARAGRVDHGMALLHTNEARRRLLTTASPIRLIMSSYGCTAQVEGSLGMDGRSCHAEP